MIIIVYNTLDDKHKFLKHHCIYVHSDSSWQKKHMCFTGIAPACFPKGPAWAEGEHIQGESQMVRVVPKLHCTLDQLCLLKVLYNE